MTTTSASAAPVAVPDPTHHVKVRQQGATRWAFLTPRGGTNYLRVHAAQYAETRAHAVVAEIAAEHDGAWEAKVVPIDRAARPR